MRQQKHQRGFLLLQTALAIAVLSYLLIQAFSLVAQYQRHQHIMTTKADMEVLADAVLAYRSDEAQTWYKSWPSLAQLAVAGYGITNATPINAWGNVYTFGLQGNALTIITTTDGIGEARDVAGYLGVAGTAAGAVVSLVVPIPGHESSHNELVARDGTRTMQGTLRFGTGANIDLNGNSIARANAIVATGSIQVTNPANTGSITANVVSADAMVSARIDYN